ncbi:protein of unknown function, ATP-binding protein, partial [mine drainage metagenome]
VDVVGLLTTITETFSRVSMHGVREAILDAQAAAVGLPLAKVRIPFPCPNSIYEARMAEVTRRLRERSVTHVASGISSSRMSGPIGKKRCARAG